MRFGNMLNRRTAGIKLLPVKLLVGLILHLLFLANVDYAMGAGLSDRCVVEPATTPKGDIIYVCSGDPIVSNTGVGIALPITSDQGVQADISDLASIETSGFKHHGIAASTRTGDLFFVNTADILTHGQSADGINLVTNGGFLRLENHGNILVEGSGVKAISAVNQQGGGQYISNSGTLSTLHNYADGIYSYTTGDVEPSRTDIVNSGSITTEGRNSAGIRVYNINGTSYISNTGSITTSGLYSAAIEVHSKGGGHITNSGVLTASQSAAIQFDSENIAAHADNSLTNSGTIDGFILGFASNELLVNEASGRINSSNGDTNLGNGDDSIHNAGFLEGRFDLGKGTDSLYIYSTSDTENARIIGGMGYDSVFLDGEMGGLFNPSGLEEFEVLNVIGGHWQILDSVDMDLKVHKDGSLVIPDATELVVNGNYTAESGSTTLFGLSEETSGLLRVNGQANFLSGSEIFIDVNTSAELVGGTRYHLVAASDLEDAANFDDNSALFDFRHENENGNLFVVAVQRSFNEVTGVEFGEAVEGEGDVEESTSPDISDPISNPDQDIESPEASETVSSPVQEVSDPASEIPDTTDSVNNTNEDAAAPDNGETDGESDQTASNSDNSLASSSPESGPTIVTSPSQNPDDGDKKITDQNIYAFNTALDSLCPNSGCTSQLASKIITRLGHIKTGKNLLEHIQSIAPGDGGAYIQSVTSVADRSLDTVERHFGGFTENVNVNSAFTSNLMAYRAIPENRPVVIEDAIDSLAIPQQPSARPAVWFDASFTQSRYGAERTEKGHFNSSVSRSILLSLGTELRSDEDSPWRIGVAADAEFGDWRDKGYSHTQADFKGFGASMYGGLKNEQGYVFVSAGFRNLWNQQERAIPLFNEVATSEYQTKQYYARIATAFRLPTEQHEIILRGGLQYSHTNVSGYEEEGSQLAMRFNEQHHRDWVANGGVSVALPFNLFDESSLKLFLNYDLSYKIKPEAPTTTAQLVAGGDSFRTVARAPEAFRHHIGLSLFGKMSDRVHYHFKGEYQTTDDFSQQGVSFKGRVGVLF